MHLCEKCIQWDTPPGACLLGLRGRQHEGDLQHRPVLPEHRAVEQVVELPVDLLPAACGGTTVRIII